MTHRRESNLHHRVTAIVLGFGLLATLEMYLLRNAMPTPFDVEMWTWVAGSTIAVVLLRGLCTELGVRRAHAMTGARSVSLVLCALTGAYFTAAPMIVSYQIGKPVGVWSWLVAIATGGPIVGGSLIALWHQRDRRDRPDE